MGRPKGRKRAAAKETELEDGGGATSGQVVESSNVENEQPAKKRGRRVKDAAPEHQDEPEYFPEKRNLEDLWQAAFPVGTEWENLDKLREFNWNFQNLEDAFEEGGELHGKKVYLFGGTEAQLLNVNGENKVILIPVVIAVVSAVPPSDKIGIKSVQREKEDIVPMKAMKMAWVPYVPLEKREMQVDRLKTQIFTIVCTQRRSALKRLKEDRIKLFDYCIPYFQHLNAEEDEDETVVDIMYPLEPPVVCQYDWEMDDLEEFTQELISAEALSESQKDQFKEFVREQVRQRRKEQRAAKEARKKAYDDMDAETKAAFENIRFYKFYPVQTADIPDISSHKASFINRYYGKAHVVL